MTRVTQRISVLAAALCLAAFATTAAFAQDDEPKPIGPEPVTASTDVEAAPKPKPPAAEASEPEIPKEELGTFHPRLPNYYNRVVDGVQRKAIYKIQESYFYQIAKLKWQIKKLEEERDRKVQGVLRPEQVNTLEQIVADATKDRAPKP